MTPEQLRQLEYTIDFAAMKHSGQRYPPHGDDPYVTHLAHTAAIPGRFGYKHLHIIQACWLHDVMEDTITDTEELFVRFGREVATIVTLVTCFSKTPEGKRAYLQSIRTNPDAVLVKLADRIANVEAAVWNKRTYFLTKYKLEHDTFRRVLYREKEYPHMWTHLDDLLKEHAGWQPLSEKMDQPLQ